jgi:predicted short-subunit dehydrogenase-like oxidoreductase (DUF2520 family)
MACRNTKDPKYLITSMNTKQTLNIIGAGKVGKTLARLWFEHGVFDIGAVMNRSLRSSEEATKFIGSGKAVTSYHDFPPAGITLIAVGDDAIENCANEYSLVTGKYSQVVFHLSGALSSSLIHRRTMQPWSVASAHPIMSFTSSDMAIDLFSGTHCGIEGDVDAVKLLKNAFRKIGGLPFDIKSDSKMLYHAASVISCNYLVALQSLAIQIFGEAGIDEKQALKVLEPIVRKTVDNIFKQGPKAALTGPIARGDVDLVQNQINALKNWDAQATDVYSSLGKIALELAEPTIEKEQASRIKKILSKS